MWARERGGKDELWLSETKERNFLSRQSSVLWREKKSLGMTRVWRGRKKYLVKLDLFSRFSKEVLRLQEVSRFILAICGLRGREMISSFRFRTNSYMVRYGLVGNCRKGVLCCVSDNDTNINERVFLWHMQMRQNKYEKTVVDNRREWHTYRKATGRTCSSE